MVCDQDPIASQRTSSTAINCLPSAPAKQEKTEAGSLLTPTDYSTSGTTPISPTSTAAELDSFHLHPPSPYTSFVPPNASALELGDTGVHRPRVELASQPTRELINVPHHQRQSAVWLEQSDSGCAELAAQPCRELINVPPHQRQQSPILSSPILSSPSPSPSQVQTDSNRANSPPVITADGIVLSANFDTSAPDTPSNRGTNSSHAMSFMDFGSARRSMLSAHRPEWENKSEEGRPNTPEGEKSSSASK
ncbi:hypothetical protein BDV28DRAFT_137304 [Aspergillus coremiiformis]|uniref:Uncharacterized protein n=1 Tax=Aspergillus coremiiformis TaxID=138285 RepID=A0A5N6Z0X8_9EURO|nr:hypothetical protein BDV28DRAFT_137304 [Aspergillus coremiiformis]